MIISRFHALTSFDFFPCGVDNIIVYSHNEGFPFEALFEVFNHDSPFLNKHSDSLPARPYYQIPRFTPFKIKFVVIHSIASFL